MIVDCNSNSKPFGDMDMKLCQYTAVVATYFC